MARELFVIFFLFAIDNVAGRGAMKKKKCAIGCNDLTIAATYRVRGLSGKVLRFILYRPLIGDGRVFIDTCCCSVARAG